MNNFVVDPRGFPYSRKHLKSGNQDDNRATPNIELRIRKDAYDAIKDTVGSYPAETGGALGVDPSTGVVVAFDFDSSAERTGITYSPDVKRLNKTTIPKVWKPQGIKFCGFVHSHPRSIARPSGGDEIYAKNILKAMKKLDRLLMPIILPADHRREFEFHPFVAELVDDEVNVRSIKFVVVDEDNQPLSEQMETTVADTKSPVIAPIPLGSVPSQAFDRVQSAYDIERMRNSRLVIVGAGGARQFVEEMARAAIGQIVLIDPDNVELPNIGTQQVFRNEIGVRKTDAMADAIRQINPDVVIEAHPVELDMLDDAIMHRVLLGSLKDIDLNTISGAPAGTLLCGFTDYFPAQARVNRLALKYGVPSISAQVYQEGRGMEVTFTHPDYTEACHRCVLAARYKALLSPAPIEQVGSAGTPIFATTRLNALKGMISLALLHDVASHRRWTGLLERMRNKNLVQIRFDPDIASHMGMSVFDRVFERADTKRLVMDETVWLPQKADHPDRNGHPHCPDCGGTGSLRDSIGKFRDTRQSSPSFATPADQAE